MAVPQEVHTALAQLLHGLQSTDNSIRGTAEEQLNTEWVSQRPDLLLMGLAEQISGSTEDGVSREDENTQIKAKNLENVLFSKHI